MMYESAWINNCHENCTKIRTVNEKRKLHSRESLMISCNFFLLQCHVISGTTWSIESSVTISSPRPVQSTPATSSHHLPPRGHRTRPNPRPDTNQRPLPWRTQKLMSMPSAANTYSRSMPMENTRVTVAQGKLIKRFNLVRYCWIDQHNFFATWFYIKLKFPNYFFQGVQGPRDVGEPHALSHWREAVRVLAVWQEVFKTRPAEGTQEETLWVRELRVHPLRQKVFHLHQAAGRKSPFIISILVMHSQVRTVSPIKNAKLWNYKRPWKTSSFPMRLRQHLWKLIAL